MKIRRTIALTGAGLMAASMAFPASAAHTARFEGDTRYDTAAALSGTVSASDSVIVTTGENFPDALAASYLSQRLLGAPILLTEKESLDEATEAEIDRLDPATIYLLGGPDAISDETVEELEDTGADVERIEGDTRYETAQLVAQFESEGEEGASNIGTLGASGRTAIVATGENFPDALAAGPLAFESSFPIILTETNTLRDEAREALEDLDIEYVIVLGGPVAITADVQSEIEDMDITTRRIEGDTRRGTATAVADFARTRLGFTQDDVILATGEKFPDALAAGPYGGRLEAPIVLTETADSVGAETLSYLDDQQDAIDTVIALGGQVAITTDTHDAALTAAGQPTNAG